jgi:hypothetical protein
MNKGLLQSVEDGYRKLNSMGSKKPMSLDDWITFIFPLIALCAPRLTGIRESLSISITMFGELVIYTLVRHRSEWLKRVSISAVGCLILYSILEFIPLR